MWAQLVSVLMELRVLNCILRAMNKLLTVPGRKVTCLNVTFREMYLVYAVGNGLEEVRKGSVETIISPHPLFRIKEVVFTGGFYQAQLAGELGTEY